MKTISYDLCEAFLGKLDEEQEDEPRNRRELLRLMRRVIDQALTSRQKTMIDLHFYEGHTVTEIAQMLGLNKSTVSRTLKRAVGNLKKYMMYYIM